MQITRNGETELKFSLSWTRDDLIKFRDGFTYHCSYEDDLSKRCELVANNIFKDDKTKEDCEALCRQLSAAGVRVISWTQIEEKRLMNIAGQKDKNWEDISQNTFNQLRSAKECQETYDKLLTSHHSIENIVKAPYDLNIVSPTSSSEDKWMEHQWITPMHKLQQPSDWFRQQIEEKQIDNHGFISFLNPEEIIVKDSLEEKQNTQDLIFFPTFEEIAKNDFKTIKTKWQHLFSNPVKYVSKIGGPNFTIKNNKINSFWTENKLALLQISLFLWKNKWTPIAQHVFNNEVNGKQCETAYRTYFAKRWRKEGLKDVKRLKTN